LRCNLCISFVASARLLDGNKRIAAATSEIFIELNGGHLTASNEEIVDLFLAIAASEKTRDDVEAVFAEWLIIPTP
jgi:prophage maintenance system killer protein